MIYDKCGLCYSLSSAAMFVCGFFPWQLPYEQVATHCCLILSEKVHCEKNRTHTQVRKGNRNKLVVVVLLFDVEGLMTHFCE